MSTLTAQNADIVRAFVETVWNTLEPAKADAYLAPNYRDHAYAPGDGSGLKKAIEELGAAIPDARSTIEDLVADGDRVAVRMVLRGRHLGTFRGNPASGATVEVKVNRWYRLDGERIAEHWALFDTAALLRQIAIPAAS